jgi:DNA-binding winged helix-turn-helix (wHTH) protein
MTATDSMAIRAFGRRHQLNDTVSRLDLFPVSPHAGGTQATVPMRASTEREISFGPFCLLPNQRLLTKAGKEVRVGSRVLDILIALLEHPGKLITRRELMERVWPQTVVVEANLNVNVAALRRVLGDGQDGNRYLVTIPGRGYRFVGSVTLSDFNHQDPEAFRPANDLPTPIARLFGRDEIVKQLTGELRQHGFVTITGPGGIGKSSVALAVAAELMGNYKHGIFWADLASIEAPDHVPSTVADVLGVETRAEDAISGLVAELKDKDVLLVLDNCEHLVAAVAYLAIVLLKAAPGLKLLVTSRRPLCAAGERVRRLMPLESPPTSTCLDAAEAIEFPALQLFVECAAARMNDFEFSDSDVPMIATICRRLDGVPLAIELAATLVDALGVRDWLRAWTIRLDC